jgi:hypothetical protein
MSRVRRYSRSGPTAQPPRSPTGLSPPAVTRSSGLRLTDAGTARALPPPPAHSSNPPLASPAGYSASGVWAPPRSLAATKGILSVPRGTEMFQFPRCPLGNCSPSARPCAGRVAPFGHPRIAGCQRLPGAFRRVAASFLGRQRQGIHHAPILRIPASPPSRAPRGRDRRPARASGMVPSGRGTCLWPRRCGAPWVMTVIVARVSVCICVYCSSVRAGERIRAPRLHRQRCSPGSGHAMATRARAPATIASPAAAEPNGFRVALCQSAQTRRSTDP